MRFEIDDSKAIIKETDIPRLIEEYKSNKEFADLYL